MTRLRTLIIDDEAAARRRLRLLLGRHPDVDVVGEAVSVATALTALETLAPDLLLLDIQLPDGSGLDLFAQADVRAAVVFVTAFDRYAVRAFEVNALDYVLKPVIAERLGRALDRCREPPPRPSAQLAGDDVVCVRTVRGTRFVPVDDIVLVEAADDYSEIRRTDGSMTMTSIRMHEWERRLPARFVRVHRSTIVDGARITGVRSDVGGHAVEVRGVVERVRIGRRYLPLVRERLGF